MSGTFPASPAPRAFKFGSIQPTRVSTSHSLKRYTRTTNAQRWTLSLDFSQLTRLKFMPIWAFLIGQRGQYDTFQYVLPAPLYSPQGVGATGSPSPTVNGNFGSPVETQSGRTVYTKGWPNSTAILKMGDFIKFGSHSKVYMARSDVTSDSSGFATVDIGPALVQAVSDGDAIITHNIPFTVSLTRDDNSFSLSIGAFFQPQTVELVEAL